MANQLYFFRSYYLAGKSVGDRRGEFYSMLLDYMFEGVLPDQEDDLYGMFLLAKPTIDVSLKRAEVGAKGGANKKANTGAKAVAKEEANPVANPVANAEAKTDRSKEKEKEKEKSAIALRARAGDAAFEAPVTLAAAISHAELHFSAPRPPAGFVADWYRRMEEGGWRDRRGNPLTNGRWQRELSVWWRTERKKETAPRADDQVRGADGAVLTSPDPNEVF